MKKVFYTFGNHMHWIDMEWMWGPGTLENSAKEMLELIEKNNLKGAINFDAIGYEYLAWEYPETFKQLKKALEDGKIEIAAGTYTQPYPLFIGEESNIQQIVTGVKTCERLFGVRPKLFWEEEFYFFPQLPQILLQAGYDVYSFFFQETWHTPYVPKFDEPTFIWQGKDDSEIPALAFTGLCIHQWPEHLQKSIEFSLKDESQPILIQWLELLKSPKWMCRAELIEKEMSKLRELFEFQPIKPSEVIAIRKPQKRISFKSSELYHGLSIGKNGNILQIERRKIENKLLDAQTLAVIAYVNNLSPQWSEYPSWEIKEAQRFLMISQAHDIDECEGFCGDIGKVYLKTSQELLDPVMERYMNMFSKMLNKKFELCVFNPLPWERRGYVKLEETEEIVAIDKVPALSVAGIDKSHREQLPVKVSEECIEVYWQEAKYEVFPDGIIRTEFNGKEYEFNRLLCANHKVENVSPLSFKRILPDLVEVHTSTKVGPYFCDQKIYFGEINDWIEMQIQIELLEKPRPGYDGGLMVEIQGTGDLQKVRYDYPFGVEEGLPSIEHYRYYPKGSWMTSEKFFERIVNHFASLRFVQILTQKGKFSFLHKGNHGFIRDGSKLYCVLYLYDPWDEENFAKKVSTKYGFSFDQKKDPLRMAQEFNRPMIAKTADGKEQGFDYLQAFKITGDTQVSALYVEDNSVILRLWNPKEENQKIQILPNFQCKEARKINLLGEEIEPVKAEIELKPFEIATLKYIPVSRAEENLDKFRYVWSEYQKKRWISDEGPADKE